jgi:hypothetical protein
MNKSKIKWLENYIIIFIKIIIPDFVWEYKLIFRYIIRESYHIKEALCLFRGSTNQEFTVAELNRELIILTSYNLLKKKRGPDVVNFVLIKMVNKIIFLTKSR